MNPRLRRRTIVSSLTCFLGFGTWSGLSYYHYRDWVSFLDQVAQETTRMPAMCVVDKAVPKYQKWLVCVSAREHQATLAIGLPCTAFFLLYVGTWVMVGKLRRRPE